MNKHNYTLHPWHGVSYGEHAPEIVTAYIEIVPTDSVKYEVDKASGLLKVDRPQRFSNYCPVLYGFIPQTFCDNNVASYCMEKTNRKNIIGDQDPLDICILSSVPINQSNILLQAIPIGGFRMIDKNEADDKIIAVLKGDLMYEHWDDINDASTSLIERLKHYFLTYKDMPGSEEKRCEITHCYNKQEALEVIRRSISDYRSKFANG